MSRNQIKVVSTLPISTTNMTGFLMTFWGASFRKLSQIAGRTISGSKSERSFKRVSAMSINLSCRGHKMFDDRPKRKRGEEGQRADDDNDTD
jgi:hypothetical protein